ncbi:MAG: hypothetical protein WC459_04110 [Patescibacteria group bacterium]
MEPRIESKNFKLESVSGLSKKDITKKQARAKEALALAEKEIKKVREKAGVPEKKRKAQERELKIRQELAQLSNKEADLQFDFSDEDEDKKIEESAKKRKKPSRATQEAINELREKEAEKMREQEEDNIPEIEPDEILEEGLEAAEKLEVAKIKKSIDEPEIKKTQENKNALKLENEIKERLRASLSDYPELLAPEIKKNLEIIRKNEEILEKNEGNAKKSAREKVKTAREVIDRATTAVNDYADKLAEKYSDSQEKLMELSRILFGEQKNGRTKSVGGLEAEINALYQKKFGPNEAYTPPKKGLFAGIKGFFRDRKIKKTMGGDWDEFQVKQSEYAQKLEAYNNMLAEHGKRFGRLEETLESGTTFRLAGRGGSERLPGIKGR